MNWLRYWTSITVLVLAAGLTSRVQAQATNPLGLLENAHATLAQADHDYDGHRAEAMKQIRVAIYELTGASRARVHAHVRVRHTVKVSGKGHEAQSASDAQLRAAENMLEQAASGLSGNAFQHVNGAIAQLNTALSIR
jgi:hypothetical protein